MDEAAANGRLSERAVATEKVPLTTANLRGAPGESDDTFAVNLERRPDEPPLLVPSRAREQMSDRLPCIDVAQPAAIHVATRCE